MGYGLYATDTEVSADRSRAEIERTLQRYGATHFMYGWDPGAAIILFQMRNRRIKFLLPLPDKAEFSKTPGGRRMRNAEATLRAWEQATRQRWRALLLTIKAKLEAVEAGISVFEDEFLAHILLPDNRTVGEHIRPKVEAAYASGRLPPALLPWDGEGKANG